MTEQKIRRVNSIIILRDVEVDLEKVNQLFAPLPEKIPVRCKPGVCEFNLNGVTVTAYNEHIDKEYQEELCNGCENVRYLITGGMEVWESNHFEVIRDPGIISFYTRKYDSNGDLKIIPLGGIIVLPQCFAERLEKLTPEEQQKLLRWMLRHLEYVCPGMIVLNYLLRFPIDEYEEIEQLINKVGRLEAVDLGYCECDVEDVRYLRRGKCDIDDIRYCDIYETTDYRYGTVEWLANEPFRHGHDCRFVLWP